MRRERVCSALLWLKENNPLYRNVDVDDEALSNFPDNDILPVHIETVESTQQVDLLTSRYDLDEPSSGSTSQSTLSHAQTMKEEAQTTIYDSVVVTDVDGDATTNQL